MMEQKADGRGQTAGVANWLCSRRLLPTAYCLLLLLLPTALRAQGTNARSEQSGNGAPTGNCSVFANDYSQVRVDRATGKHYNCVGTPGTNTGTWVEATAAAGAVLNTRQVLTTSPLSGGGDLSADRTLTCPTCEVTTHKDAANGYAGLDASTWLKTAEFPAFTGDITTTAGGVVSVLKNTGTAGTYRSATFDAQGRETSGTNPTTFAGYGISDTIANFFVAVPGPVPEASGGTGSNVTTGAAGHYLRSNATHYVDSAIQVADVPTLNQNTTGTATNATNVGTITKADNVNYFLTFVGANSSSNQAVDVGPATYNPSTNLITAAFSGAHNGTVGATTPAAGSFTTLASGIITANAQQTIGVGATSSALTDLLINPTTKASGNLIDAQVGGTSKFSVTFAGNLTSGPINVLGGGLTVAASNAISWSGAGYIFGGATTGANTGTMRIVAGSGNEGLNFGGDTSSFVSLVRSSQTLKVRLADNSADAPITASNVTASGALSVAGASTQTGGTTIGTSGTAILRHLSATATLDFVNLAAIGCEDLTINVTNAALGDAVAIGVPNGSVVANGTYTGWVSSAGVVSIRFCTVVSGDPASGTFRADVWQH